MARHKCMKDFAYEKRKSINHVVLMNIDEQTGGRELEQLQFFYYYFIKNWFSSIFNISKSLQPSTSPFFNLSNLNSHQSSISPMLNLSKIDRPIKSFLCLRIWVSVFAFQCVVFFLFLNKFHWSFCFTFLFTLLFVNRQSNFINERITFQYFHRKKKRLRLFSFLCVFTLTNLLFSFHFTVKFLEFWRRRKWQFQIFSDWKETTKYDDKMLIY